MTNSDEDNPDVVAARRAFLKAVVYTAPVIATSVQVSRAEAQKGSCGPTSCLPQQGCGPVRCPPALGCPPVR